MCMGNVCCTKIKRAQKLMIDMEEQKHKVEHSISMFHIKRWPPLFRPVQLNCAPSWLIWWSRHRNVSCDLLIFVNWYARDNNVCAQYLMCYNVVAHNLFRTFCTFRAKRLEKGQWDQQQHQQMRQALTMKRTTKRKEKQRQRKKKNAKLKIKFKNQWASNANHATSHSNFLYSTTISLVTPNYNHFWVEPFSVCNLLSNCDRMSLNKKLLVKCWQLT